MRNNETGEFELVVGNRQLLSGFFIVVLLFAVGVALGYILGQNSEKSLRVADASNTIPSTAQPRPSAAPVQPAANPPADTSQPPSAAPSAPVETQAARDAQAAAAPAERPVEHPAGPASDLPEAAPGTYWQVMAVARADADKVAHTLKNAGFPAVLSPGTKGLTRVLVGPYADRTALSKAKTELEAAGMATPYRVEVGK